METNAHILDGFAPEPIWCEINHLKRRTAARYRKQGMPFVLWNGQVWIDVKGSREFLLSRVKRPPLRTLRNRQQLSPAS
jgi:hypothetical protein